MSRWPRARRSSSPRGGSSRSAGGGGPGQGPAREPPRARARRPSSRHGPSPPIERRRRGRHRPVPGDGSVVARRRGVRDRDHRAVGDLRVRERDPEHALRADRGRGADRHPGPPVRPPLPRRRRGGHQRGRHGLDAVAGRRGDPRGAARPVRRRPVDPASDGVPAGGATPAGDRSAAALHAPDRVLRLHGPCHRPAAGAATVRGRGLRTDPEQRRPHRAVPRASSARGTPDHGGPSPERHAAPVVPRTRNHRRHRRDGTRPGAGAARARGCIFGSWPRGVTGRSGSWCACPVGRSGM